MNPEILMLVARILDYLQYHSMEREMEDTVTESLSSLLEMGYSLLQRERDKLNAEKSA